MLHRSPIHALDLRLAFSLLTLLKRKDNFTTRDSRLHFFCSFSPSPQGPTSLPGCMLGPGIETVR